MRAKLIATALTSLLGLVALPAQATFHLMKVVEVFPGTAAAPNAQYVVIQMYSTGENHVGGHAITVFNAAGTQVAAFTFAGDVSNGANQAKILIATPEAEAFFGVTADLRVTASILAAGGKLCWAGSIDCVSWGSYSGSAAGVGTPFNASGGLLSGKAAGRRLDIAGSPTVLDSGDDTDNSANDFVFRLPAPRNNLGMLGVIPGATCGNGVLEGLEQCDDHNLANGDGCSSTCTVDAVILDHVLGDFGGDGKADVFWRNGSTGTNAIWKSGNAATPQTVVGVSAAWKVVARGDFDGDGKFDVFWRNTSSGADAIWRSGNAATALAVVGVTSQAWKVVGAGDFDGDGKSDVFWRNTSTGANVIWKSGNAATPQSVTGVATQWEMAGIGDFNGDGKSDVFWRNTSSGANAIWKSGNAATPQTVGAITSQAWKLVAVADFDGDGKADLLWRNITSGANTIWGAASSARGVALTGVTDQHWQVASTGDFNGDGKSDVFWRNTGTGDNVIWNSANAATQQAVSGVTGAAWSVVPHEGQTFTVTVSALPAISIANASVSEGNSGSSLATFTILLSQAATSTVTYNIATANGSAIAGSDYVAASASGQTIPAGQTSKTFAVTINGDTVDESNETFTVNLSNVVGATVADGQAIGTIIDDDTPYGY